MQRWKPLLHLNHQSLRTRLIIWFLIIALVPLGWTTLIIYQLSKRILFEEVSKHLQGLISKQEKILNFYFHEKQLDARDFIRDQTALMSISTLDETLSRYGKNSPEFSRSLQMFYPLLTFRMKALDYQNLLLVTKTGKIVFSTSPFFAVNDHLLDFKKYESLQTIFEKTLHTLAMEMTSLVLKPDKSSLNAYISIPILDAQDQLAGVAIVELDTSSIYHFISNFQVRGILANLLVVAKVNDNLYAINPSETQNDQSPNHPVDPNSSFGRFIQKVLLNEDLIEADIDYRNQTTLMVGRKYASAFNWALMTKIDEAELLAPIHRLKSLFWILVTTTVFAVLLAASYVARKITSPILLLTDKTKTLAAGDLSQRIEVTSQDEIGRLGESFNEMATQLNHIISHLDDLVEKRTKEYENQNVKLEQTIKELRQTRDRLITQEKLASLGALTAGIAHEIKNPLNFIHNFSELSLELQKDLEELIHSIKPPLPEIEKEKLSELSNTLKLNITKIYEHGKRADSIVYHMLQHSRGTPGEKTKIDVHKLLDEYITLAYHGMRAQDPSFNVNTEKHYDASIPSLEVVPQEMSRVFLNLLNNAYYSVQQKKKQHHTDTSYPPTVRISTENHGDSVVIKIWDNGLGIAPEIFPKLFTPFFTTKPTGEGTGLGLSLSYNIVVQGHGGTLSANSQVGEFAEFVINLPSNFESGKFGPLESSCT
jgi:signal transduction histidine kinase